MSLFSKTTVTVKNTAKDIGRRIRGVIGALIGATGVYAGIRKAMTTWLAQNDELQQKLNGAWYALGSLFAPILEWIINKFVYFVSLVDALVKSLGFAGVNMSKFGKKSGQASKQLAGFDEINNLNSQSGGGGGAGMQLDPVSDEALNKFKSILAIVTAIGAGILAWKVADSVNNIFKAFGKEGLDPVQIAGIGVAIGGAVLAISSFINYMNDPSWLNFGLIITGIGVALAGVGMIIGNTPLIIAGVVTAILGILASFWPQISGWIDTAVEWIDGRLEAFYDWLIYWFGDIGEQWASSIARYWDLIKSFIQTAKNFLDDLFNGVKKIVDGIVQMFKGDLKGGIQTAIEGIKIIFKGLLNVGIDIANGLISAVSNGINRVIDMLNTVHYDVPSWVPFVGGKSFGINIPHVPQYSIPRLASGTNYVPNDMLAQLHQGEAVVPKAFNEDQYNNSEETNELLRELIDVVGSKEFRAYISQREIGEASLNYQRSKQRIMGGGLV